MRFRLWMPWLFPILLAACAPQQSFGPSGGSMPPSAPAGQIPVGLLGPAKGARCDLRIRFIHDTFHGPRQVLAGPGVLAFSTDYAVNTDGAPNAYDPRDPWGKQGRAVNTVCDAVNARTAAGETVDYRQCSRLIGLFRRARDAGWSPAAPQIDFYGAATPADQGPGAHRPCLQTAGPDAGAMVSTTSRAANPGLGRCDQRRYLNALSLPFIIVPGGSRLAARGMRLGDLAVVVNPANGRMVYAMVGDTGPQRGLGEGSVALNMALLGQTALPRTRAEARRLALPRTFTFVMPGARISRPYTPARIAAAGAAALDKLGGPARLRACLDAADR